MRTSVFAALMSSFATADATMAYDGNGYGDVKNVDMNGYGNVDPVEKNGYGNAGDMHVYGDVFGADINGYGHAVVQEDVHQDDCYDCHDYDEYEDCDDDPVVDPAEVQVTTITESFTETVTDTVTDTQTEFSTEFVTEVATEFVTDTVTDTISETFTCTEYVQVDNVMTQQETIVVTSTEVVEIQPTACIVQAVDIPPSTCDFAVDPNVDPAGFDDGYEDCEDEDWEDEDCDCEDFTDDSWVDPAAGDAFPPVDGDIPPFDDTFPAGDDVPPFDDTFPVGGDVPPFDAGGDIPPFDDTLPAGGDDYGAGFDAGFAPAGGQIDDTVDPLADPGSPLLDPAAPTDPAGDDFGFA